MRFNILKSRVIKSGLAAAALLLAGGAAFGQSVTATPSGTVDVGASLTTTNTLVVTNPIGALPLNVSSVTGFGLPFSLSADACSGTTVAPGGTCAVAVTFSPTAFGTATPDPITVSGTTTDS